MHVFCVNCCDEVSTLEFVVLDGVFFVRFLCSSACLVVLQWVPDSRLVCWCFLAFNILFLVYACGWHSFLDYLETFSAVATLTSIQVILSLALNFDWPLYQLDVKKDIPPWGFTEVYMDPPPGFVVRGLEDTVCFLKKSLYGLKQSPRAWFERFSRVVLKYGAEVWVPQVLCWPYSLCEKEEYEGGHTYMLMT